MVSSSAFCLVLDRDVVVVSGRDASSFLQSLVSQDLDPLEVGDSVHTLLLQPQGKLTVDLRATRVADLEWWCDCEPGFGSALAEALRRFRIRVEADIEPRLDIAMLAVRGARPDIRGDGVVVVPGLWDGVDVLGDRSVIEAISAPVRVASFDEYERSRIEAGVPRQGFDVDERTIPQEASLERDAVSFTKGCFLGQELVCRIDTRGHVNRTLRRLRAADGVLAAGATVHADGREVGTVTSSVGDVALAMLRREVEPGAEVDVSGARAITEALQDA